MTQPDAPRVPLRFRIAFTFMLPDWGTVVVGEIEQGEVREGDELRVDGTDVVFTCVGIRRLRRVDHGPNVGLLTSPGHDPAQFPAGALALPADSLW